MGNSNSNNPAPGAAPQRQQAAATTVSKPSSLKKIAMSEKKMMAYNWVPKNLAKTKASKKFCRLLKKRRHWVKSIKIDSNTLANPNSELIRILPSFKSLKTIEIEYWGNIDLKFAAFKYFAKVVGPLKYLKTCIIRNNDPDNLTLRGSILLLRGISYLKNLREVDFNFTNCLHNNMSADLLKVLVANVTKVRKAEKLTLDVSTCERFSNPGMLEFAKGFYRFQNLQELNLDFGGCSGLEKTGFDLLVQNICKIDLKHLKLNFGGLKFLNDQGFALASQNIGNIKNLNTLNLAFGGSDRIEKAGVSSLVKCIDSLKHLKELRLDFTGCRAIKDIEITTFSDDSNLFERLTVLNLNFTNCSITDISIILLAKCIQKLGNLQELLLAVGGHEQIGDHGVIELGKAMAQLKNLSKLKLMFIKTQVKDHGLGVLLVNICTLRQLKDLYIDFSINQKITGKGLITFSYNIEQLSELQDLVLDFSHSPNMSSEGVLSLSQHIPKLRKLCNIQLKFQNCLKINKAAQDALKFFEKN